MVGGGGGGVLELPWSHSCCGDTTHSAKEGKTRFLPPILQSPASASSQPSITYNPNEAIRDLPLRMHSRGQASGMGLRANKFRAFAGLSQHLCVCVCFLKGRKIDLYPKALFTPNMEAGHGYPLSPYQVLDGRLLG